MQFLKGYAFCENSIHRHTALTSTMLSGHESSNPEQFAAKLSCFLHWSNNGFGLSGNTVTVAKSVLMPPEMVAYLFHLENRERQPWFPSIAYYRFQFGKKNT